MVEVRPGVTQADLDAIAAQPREIEAKAIAGGVPLIRAEQVVAGGVLLVDGEPRVAAGIVDLAPKLGLVWLTANVNMKPYAKHLLRAMRACVQQAEARGYRLVGAATAGVPEAAAFMDHLGFEWTGRTDVRGSRLYEKRK